MIQIKSLSDSRLDTLCAYCSDLATTKDHVPSKVLLDEPYPENIPNVPCCHKCNHDFSLDEEYVACAFECYKYGTTDIDKLGRIKVVKSLQHNNKLKESLTNAFYEDKGKSFFEFDQKRLFNVIVKLAKGHAKFENSESNNGEPQSIRFNIIDNLSEDEQKDFFSPPVMEKYPEVGSRGMIAVCENGIPHSRWITVQENHYSYMVNITISFVDVRIFSSNLFCIQVII